MDCFKRRKLFILVMRRIYLYVECENMASNGIAPGNKKLCTSIKKETYRLLRVNAESDKHIGKLIDQLVQEKYGRIEGDETR